MKIKDKKKTARILYTEGGNFEENLRAQYLLDSWGILYSLAGSDTSSFPDDVRGPELFAEEGRFQGRGNIQAYIFGPGKEYTTRTPF